MRPTEVLMHLRDAWLQEPQRALTLMLCPACWDALFNDLANLFTLKPSPRLEDSQVMGFALRHGTPDQCALHAYMQEEAPCPLK